MSTGNDRQSDDNILTLAPASENPGTLGKIKRYWNGVRGNRLVPSRCEIDPRGLDGVLGHAFVLERVTGGLARFRIAGSHISDLTGVEMRQMPVSALFLPASREILADALVSVFDDPAMVRLSITSTGGFGRPKLAGEMILLPLRSDLGDIDRVLGGIVMDGATGRGPRRLDIVSQSRTALTGFAGPAHGTTTPVELPKRRVTADLPAPAPRGSHLRLVVSND